MHDLAITFDNLGEASEVEQGLWPRFRRPGRHHSVVRVLPRLLAVLDSVGMRATFFVEGVNAEAYPEALAQIAAAGHEIGLHAWRHEEWGALEPSREAELLERGTRALADLGHRPHGFRPPGGRMTAQTARLLRDHGYRYASPAGEQVTSADGLTILPFRWEQVDAYFHFPGPLRRRMVEGGSANGPSLPPEALWALYQAAIRVGSIAGAGRLRREMLSAMTADDGFTSFVFHPFLLRWNHTMRAMTEVLKEVVRRDDVRVATMGEVARAL